METVTYTITLTEAENDALAYAAVDPEAWIANMVRERARLAMDSIIDICVKACLDNQVQLPMTKPEIIDLAFDNGWVKSLAEQEAQNIAEMQSRSAG
jgi:hypothetical protein